MKHISHPIIGDANHGRSRHNRYFAEQFGQVRLMPATTGMIFIHPVSGEKLHLKTEPEASFLQVLSIFESDTLAFGRLRIWLCLI